MKIKSYLFIFFIISLTVVFITFIKFKDVLTIELVLKNYDLIILYIDHNFIKSIFIFSFLYALLVLLNFPVVSILSLAGGLFYGTFLGGVIVCISATVGAFLFFIIAKYFFYDFFKIKLLKYLSKFEKYFKKNELGFLILIRFSGLPFFIQNLIPAFLGANYSKFIITTFIGIMPFTFVFTNIGSKVNELILSGEKIGMHLLLQPQYIAPIICFLILIIAGIILKNRLKL